MALSQQNVQGRVYDLFSFCTCSMSDVTIEDPYIRLPHQVENLARFCALAIRCGSIIRVELVSGLSSDEDTDDADSRLETLKRDLQGRGVMFTWRRVSNLHDREVRCDNGWTVKIGRGLDIYHKPESRVSMEAADYSLRRCRQTKVDIYRDSDALR
jgi:ATP-dependent Lon protease